MTKVLLTGATGFLGSYIAEALIDNGYSVIALKRSASDCWRCKPFLHKIEWLDMNNEAFWKNRAANYKPSIIIHAAWVGVEANARENWTEQIKNIDFMMDLLILGKELNIEKFICLGSQAEYGYTDALVDEFSPLNPYNAYGSIKAASLEIFKCFCTQNNINWVWLRLFSLFGAKENRSWLIPSLIIKLMKEKEMDLTLGMQKYAYLYVKDFSQIVTRIVNGGIESGVYNISSNKVLSLKDIIQYIATVVNPEFKLNFGAVEYRKNQSMHIEGDISKLVHQIGPVQFSDFDTSINETIEYYTSKKSQE